MHGLAPIRIRKPSAKCLHPNIRDVTSLIRGLFLFFTSLCSFSSYLCSVLTNSIFSGTERVCRAERIVVAQVGETTLERVVVAVNVWRMGWLATRT